MSKLLYKELRLALHPVNIIFLSFSAMLLIPNYPYLVTFFYTTLGIFFMCLSGRENRDIEYSALLPISKKDIVTARFMSVTLVELSQIAISLPFAFIRSTFPEDILVNMAGSAPSLAFYGLVFALFGLFNLLFFTRYYKNPNKVGLSFFVASIAVFIVVVADAALSNVPALYGIFRSYGGEALWAKLTILVGGMAVCAVLTLISYNKSVKSFIKLDL